MESEYIPQEIKTIVKSHNGTLQELEPPTKSENSEDLTFCKVELSTTNASIIVDLAQNSKLGDEFVPEALTYLGYEFSDESPEQLLDILTSILDGRVAESETIFHHKRLNVTDSQGRTYQSR